MDKTATEVKVVSAQVPVALVDELRRKAAEADGTLSAEVRRALGRYVTADDKEETQ